MEGYIKSEILNGIGIITFFHPQSNSMPGALLRQLAKEITMMGKNDSAKVILLKSEGEKSFCAGASFDELISINDLETGKKFFSGFAMVINAMRQAPTFHSYQLFRAIMCPSFLFLATSLFLIKPLPLDYWRLI